MMNGKILSFAVATALLVSCAYAIVHEDIGNADEFFDHFLESLLQEPNITQQVQSVEIPNINQGNFQTWGGWVSGLTTLKRDGHCTYSLSDQDKQQNKQNTAFLRTQVASSRIRFSMNYQVKILFVTVSGVMEGKVGDMAAALSFQLNEKVNIKMDEFKIARFDGFEITRVSTNLSQSSWIMRMVANSLASKNKPQIVQSLTNGMADYLRSILKDINLNNL